MRTHRNPRNLERLSGRLLYFPQKADGTFETGAIDIGDIKMHKRTVNVENKTLNFHPPTAVLTPVRRDVTKTENVWEITSEDHHYQSDLMVFFGSPGADLVQAAGVTQTTTLTDVVKGRVYKVGKLKLSNVTVLVGVAPKIVGTRDAEGTIKPANADVVLDAEIGTVEILESGSLLLNDDLIVNFDCAAHTRKVIQAGTNYQRRGTFELIEYNGEDSPFRRRHIFTGDLSLKDGGENNIENDANAFVLEVLVRGDWDIEETD